MVGEGSVLESKKILKIDAASSQHNDLHKLTPFERFCCVETKVMGLKVEFNCTEPCPPWSTCPASPVRRRTIDGCSKNA